MKRSLALGVLLSSIISASVVQADVSNHWGGSVSKTTAGFDTALAYTDTDTDADSSQDTDDIADGRIFLSVSRSF